MAIKDPEKRRKYYRDRYRNDPSYREKARVRSNARRAELQDIVREMKSHPCTDCGQTYPYYVMDFDHRDPSKKTINPSDAVRNGWALERLQAEFAKCDLVCSNCHRERTYAPLAEMD